jgi:hypothetical protein
VRAARIRVGEKRDGRMLKVSEPNKEKGGIEKREKKKAKSLSLIGIFVSWTSEGGLTLTEKRGWFVRLFVLGFVSVEERPIEKGECKAKEENEENEKSKRLVLSSVDRRMERPFFLSPSPTTEQKQTHK